MAATICRPLVFIITDGDPTEDWKPAAATLRSRTIHQPYHIVGLALGGKVRLDVLERVATAVLILEGKLDRLEAGLQDYFAWIPEVVRATSESRTAELPPGPNVLPRIPDPPPTLSWRRGDAEQASG